MAVAYKRLSGSRGGRFDQKPPEVKYIGGSFMKNADVSLAKDGYACASTLADFKEIIAKKDRAMLGYVSDSAAREAQREDFLTREVLWQEYPEYFSFWPLERGRILRCEYFTSTGIIASVKKGETYTLGYSKEVRTKEGFNNLVNFLIGAKVVPRVPVSGYNFTLRDYSSNVTETVEEVRRVDEVIFTVSDDTTLFSGLGGENEEKYIYYLSKNDGRLTFLVEKGRPYYTFP